MTTTQAAQAKRAGGTRLSNGKTVVLTEYGWHQPQEQLDERGDLNAEEAAEAWRLWDAAQKTTPPGAQPNNPVGERPESEVGRRPPAGNGARFSAGAREIAAYEADIYKAKRNARVAKKGGLR